MDFNEQNATGRITMPIIRREINSDVSEDFTLADYYPEIRKVLYVREALLTPSKFVSGNKIDVSGVIDYDLVYVSADGRVCSAPFSSEYSFSLPLDNMSDFEISEGFTVSAHTVAESSSVRVSAPRRIQIRSHLCTSVGAWGKVLCSEGTSGLDEGESFERLVGTLEGLEMVCESSDIISLSDEYRLPAENCRIALAEGDVLVGSMRVEDDTVSINGEVIIKLLVCCDGDGSSHRVIRKIPFEAQTDLDGIDMSCDPLCRANGNVTDLSIEIEEGSAHIEANLILELCGVGRREMNFTSDAYSTRRSCECRMIRRDIPVALCNKNANVSQSERITASDFGSFDGAQIIDVSASAIVDRVEKSEECYVVRGTCKYNLLCLKDGEYTSSDIRLPFKYETDIEDIDGVEIDGYDVLASVFDVRARIDGENINMDSEISLGCSIWGKRSVEMLESIDFYEPIEQSRGNIIVCFPQPEDTLWKVAKRYSVLQSEISGDPASDSFVMIET